MTVQEAESKKAPGRCLAPGSASPANPNLLAGVCEADAYVGTLMSIRSTSYAVPYQEGIRSNFPSIFP